MNIIKSVLLVLLLFVFCFQSVMASQILIPVSVINVEKDLRIERALSIVGVSKNKEKIANAIKTASNEHNLTPEFIIALIHTESTFDKYAVSSKNYNGYMQIPYSLYDARENIMIGSRIMREKLILTNGDLLLAICLYKGWGKNPPKQGLDQARRVINLYNKLIKT